MPGGVRNVIDYPLVSNLPLLDRDKAVFVARPPRSWYIKDIGPEAREGTGTAPAFMAEICRRLE